MDKESYVLLCINSEINYDDKTKEKLGVVIDCIPLIFSLHCPTTTLVYNTENKNELTFNFLSNWSGKTQDVSTVDASKISCVFMLNGTLEQISYCAENNITRINIDDYVARDHMRAPKIADDIASTGYLMIKH